MPTLQRLGPAPESPIPLHLGIYVKSYWGSQYHLRYTWTSKVSKTIAHAPFVPEIQCWFSFFSRLWGWRTIILQLSGFYCSLLCSVIKYFTISYIYIIYIYIIYIYHIYIYHICIYIYIFYSTILCSSILHSWALASHEGFESP